jgi:D-alanine-D-alanine ligase
MKIKSGMHIVLIKGGYGAERKISLKSGKTCAVALKENGFKVSEIDFNQSIANELTILKPDVCFNALHGQYGEDGNIQGLLNILKIPYTHSGVFTSAIAMHKIHFKKLITKVTENMINPIRFPKTLEFKEGNFLSVKDYNGPYVIKPINGGSSVGVLIIKNNNEAPTKNKWPINNNLMAENLVGTRELTVTVLKERPLCVTEIETGKENDFYNYNAKYKNGRSFHQLPAKIPNLTSQKAMEWALNAHKIIGCNGISRSDFRYDPVDDELFMLEINTQPGMTKTSLAPEQAAFCKIDMIKMVKILIEEAKYEC